MCSPARFSGWLGMSLGWFALALRGSLWAGLRLAAGADPLGQVKLAAGLQKNVAAGALEMKSLCFCFLYLDELPVGGMKLSKWKSSARNPESPSSTWGLSTPILQLLAAFLCGRLEEKQR